jgi:hypothetical protein
MGPSGGIFVSSVNENSLAAQAGLVIGDQLLEVFYFKLSVKEYCVDTKARQKI